MKKIVVLHIPVSGEVKLMEIEDSIECKKEFVGDNPEYIRFTTNDNMLMLANESVETKGVDVNIRASCIANIWSKQSNCVYPTLTIRGNVLIEGCKIGVNSKNIESCSIPINELEFLIDYCNKAQTWWNFATNNVANSNIFKWFTAAMHQFEQNHFKF